jgi:hypothetical protein
VKRPITLTLAPSFKLLEALIENPLERGLEAAHRPLATVPAVCKYRYRRHHR